jgi:hypothetical protein
MSEPSLSCKELPEEVYRFLRVNGTGSSVRVSEHAGVISLAAVELADGLEGTPTRRVAKNLTAREWATVLDAVKALDFWRMPGRERSEGADGEDWIIEGRRGRRYHAISRWSPEEGPIQRWLDLPKWAGFKH